MKKLILIFLSVLSFSSLADHAQYVGMAKKASFEMTWSRYGSPDMIIAQLMDNFPLITNYEYNLMECQSLTQDNRNALGDNIPSTGLPISAKPSAELSAWYSTCVKDFILAEYIKTMEYEPTKRDENGVNISEAYVGNILTRHCLANIPDYMKDNVSYVFHFYCRWEGVSKQQKLEHLKQMIRELIGPEEVFEDLGLPVSFERMAELIRGELDSFNNAPDNRYAFLEIKDRKAGDLGINDSIRIAKFLILISSMPKY